MLLFTVLMLSTVWVVGVAELDPGRGGIEIVNGFSLVYRMLSADARGGCFSVGPSWRVRACLLRKSDDSVDTA